MKEKKEKKEPGVIGKILFEYVPYVVIIVLIILVRRYVATPVRVSGNSMYPNLTNGEIMILNKLVSINRYDIVVVNDDVAGEEIIKRVIGIPGDSVEVIGGKLYINDTEIKDIYASGETGDFNKVFLGEDEYWLMGDNRSISMDSRVFGKVKRDDIKGVANFVIYPFRKFGTIKNINTN